MGLWKVDTVSRDEWERRIMRRHDLRQWLITIGQLMLMAGAVLLIIWLCREVRP